MSKAPDTPKPAPAPAVSPRRIVELRGASGRCYGRLDLETRTIAFKRGAQTETICLDDYLQQRRDRVE